MGHFTADVTVLKFLNKSHQNHEVVVGSIHNQGTTGVTSLQLQRRFDQDSMQTWEVTQITYKSIEKRGNLDVIFDIWVLFPENSMVWFDIFSLIFHEIQWIKYCRKGWISPAFPGFTVLYVWLYVMVFNMSGDIHDLVCRPLIVCLFVFFPSSFLEVKACDQQQWQWKYITAFIGLVIAFCVAVQGREVTWVCATSGVNKLYKDTYSAPLSPLREEYVRWINNGKWGTLYYETPVGRCWENEKWPFLLS